jgi:osmotically-inducible protein OsmY
MENGQLIGIISRANLVQAVASTRAGLQIAPSDVAIRDKLLAHLKTQPWAHTGLLNITVTDGIVDLWGMTSSDAERKAIRVAAECAPGVHAVNDHLVPHRCKDGNSRPSRAVLVPSGRQRCGHP